MAFTSSPTLLGNKIFSTIATGELLCVDADTGETVWKKKLVQTSFMRLRLSGMEALCAGRRNVLYLARREGAEELPSCIFTPRALARRPGQGNAT